MSALRKKCEVERYLQKDSREIDRMIADDNFPVVRLPGETRPTPRFRLRDVHTWLCQYVRGAAPLSYEEFVREFDAAQRRSGKCAVISDQ